jgi:hypothetical protein
VRGKRDDGGADSDDDDVIAVVIFLQRDIFDLSIVIQSLPPSNRAKPNLIYFGTLQ